MEQVLRATGSKEHGLFVDDHDRRHELFSEKVEQLLDKFVDFDHSRGDSPSNEFPTSDDYIGTKPCYDFASLLYSERTYRVVVMDINLRERAGDKSGWEAIDLLRKEYTESDRKAPFLIVVSRNSYEEELIQQIGPKQKGKKIWPWEDLFEFIKFPDDDEKAPWLEVCQAIKRGLNISGYSYKLWVEFEGEHDPKSTTSENYPIGWRLTDLQGTDKGRGRMNTGSNASRIFQFLIRNAGKELKVKEIADHVNLTQKVPKTTVGFVLSDLKDKCPALRNVSRGIWVLEALCDSDNKDHIQQ